MSLIWKLTLLFAVVAAAQASRKYRDQGILTLIQDMPDTPRPVKSNLEDDFMETLFMGQVRCYEQEMEGVRPFLQGPMHMDDIDVITTTDKHGYYKLFTIEKFKDEKTVRLTIRHRCELENVPHVKNCLIPMYWTEVTLPLSRMSITYNFELDKMERYTRASCLI